MSIMPIPKRRPPHVTPKQLSILKALLKRNPDGTLLDIKELMDLISPGQPRGSMLCSIRHLAAHDLIREDELVTRRGRRVRTYAPTDAGIDLVKPKAVPSP